MTGFGYLDLDHEGHRISGPSDWADDARHKVDGWLPHPTPVEPPVVHLNEGPRAGGDFTYCTCGEFWPLTKGVSADELWLKHKAEVG